MRLPSKMLIMHRIHTSAIAMVLALIGWGATVAIGQAQIHVPLVSLTDTWRYNAWGTNVPTTPLSWTATNYDDSWWLPGLPLFGTEDSWVLDPLGLSILTPIPAPATSGPLTVYFRTHFDFPSNSAAGVTLAASNLVDDGAIFYLNGKEIQRIGMPAGAASYGTFANRTVWDATSYEVFSVPATNVHSGDNVLAVELHQVNSNTVDALFGMSLTANMPTPIVILTQPVSRTNAVGTRVTFSVTVTGSNPYYRWYKRPSPVTVSVNNTLTLLNPVLASAGDYYVVVSNILGVVTSAWAHLTVMPDTFPPGLVSAVAQELAPSNTIFITFTENVLSRTATNPASYRLELAGTTNTVVVSHAAPSQNTVTLTVGRSNWVWGGDYILTVSGVADIRSNFIQSSQVGIGFFRDALAMDSPWRWDESGRELGTAWREPDFDDSAWPESTALFYFEPDDLSLCAGSKKTAITLGYTTYYFRTRFMLGDNNGYGALRLRHVVDDGAVFHLNGREFYRFNMPQGPVASTTWAQGSAGNAVCSSFTEVTVSNLLSGENVLAVEVHQAIDAQYDLVFGTEASVLAQPVPPFGALHWQRADAIHLALWWDSLGLTLQAADQLEGPWRDVSASPPVFVPATSPTQFFRLRR
jgi:hypothetical protein